MSYKCVTNEFLLINSRVVLVPYMLMLNKYIFTWFTFWRFSLRNRVGD